MGDFGEIGGLEYSGLKYCTRRKGCNIGDWNIGDWKGRNIGNLKDNDKYYDET